MTLEIAGSVGEGKIEGNRRARRDKIVIHDNDKSQRFRDFVRRIE